LNYGLGVNNLGLNYKENQAFQRIYAIPLRGLGNVFLEENMKIASKMSISYFEAMKYHSKYQRGIQELTRIQHKINQLIGKTNVGAIIKMIREELKYDKFITKEAGGDVVSGKCEKVENLDSLCDQASHYVDLEKFLADVARIIATKEEKVESRNRFAKSEEVNAVTLATVHKTKGMEFKYVFGICINDCLFPHYKATNIAEELRILYVLVSRAERGLYLSSVDNYNGKSGKVSKFLYKVFSKEELMKSAEMLSGVNN
jgi:superfamily I DNA/RNA helicase